MKTNLAPAAKPVGRPTIDPELLRTHVQRVRLSDGEKRAMGDLAEARQLSVPDLLRALVAEATKDRPPRPRLPGPNPPGADVAPLRPPSVKGAKPTT